MKARLMIALIAAGLLLFAGMAHAQSVLFDDSFNVTAPQGQTITVFSDTFNAGTVNNPPGT